MEEINMCRMGTGAGLSFPKELSTDNSVSRVILSNNLSYNLYSFVWELMCLIIAIYTYM